MALEFAARIPSVKEVLQYGCSSFQQLLKSERSVAYLALVLDGIAIIAEVAGAKRLVLIDLVSGSLPTFCFCAGPLLLIGNRCGRLDSYNVLLALNNGYKLPVLSIVIRPASIIGISAAFERTASTLAPFAGSAETPFDRLVDHGLCARQHLNLVWVLHATGEIATIRWAELCSPTGYTGSEGAAVAVPRHIRWTLTPRPKAITSLACLTPPYLSPLFDSTGEQDEEGGPAYMLIAAGSYPCLSGYRIPVQRQEQSLSELAATVSDSLQNAARGIARELKSVLPSHLRNGLAGGLGMLGAGSFVTAFRSWVDAGDGSRAGPVQPTAGHERTSTGTDLSDSEQPPPPPMWAGTAGLADAKPASVDTPALTPAVSPGAPFPSLRSVADPPRIVDQGIDFVDADRSIRSAVPDPTGRYLLCTDSFGRVTLWQSDGSPGLTLLRLKKGHRDAQVGWLLDHVREAGAAPGQDSLRIALQWVIYSPRRGTVDIWAGVHGPRVASFKIGPNARLVYSACAGVHMSGAPAMPTPDHVPGTAAPQPVIYSTGAPRCYLVLPANEAAALTAAAGESPAIDYGSSAAGPADASPAPGQAMAGAGQATNGSPNSTYTPAGQPTAQGASAAASAGLVVVELLPWHDPAAAV